MRQIISFFLALVLLQGYAQKSGQQGWYVKDYTEATAKAYLDNNYYLDKIEGIWQSTDGFKYAIEKNVENNRREQNRFRVIVLESSTNGWNPTEIKGFIDYGSINEVYSLKYFTKNLYDLSDISSENVLLVFESPIMLSFQRLNGSTITLYKLYPKTDSSLPSNQFKSEAPAAQWSGSCVAIGNRLVATNYHVVENARNLVVTGLNGDKSTNYTAEVILTDKFNDLAVMKVTDYRFNGFNIKYGIKNSVADIGTSVFVLGYPLTSTMGEDIKLTTGVISSKTGFQGDVSQYQISAAVQPGNSGGPLFDENGNLIGIVSAKHTGAENVGYAIKLSYLQNLLDSSNEPISMNSTNTISSLSLPEKVKAISPCVLLVKANVGTSSNNSSGQNINGGNPTNQGPSSNNMAKAESLLQSSGEKFERQDFEGAYRDACASVELYPTPASHYIKGYLAAMFANDPDAAIPSLEYCLNNNYNSGDCCAILTICFSQKRDWEKVILYADKSLSYNRQNINALELRGIVKSEFGRDDEAIADYLQAIKYEGIVEYDFANVYNNLAFIYMNKGELNVAKDYISKSIKHNHMYGNAWDTYGELNYKLGNYAECIECMNNSITICNAIKDDYWIGNSYYYRGLAKKSLGDLAGAYKDLEKAVENNRESASIELSKLDASSIDFSIENSYNEVYPNPSIRKNGAPQMLIKGIELSNEYTAIYFQWTNTEFNPSGWYAIERDAYIRDKSTGKKYTLLATDNCGVSPNPTPIRMGETKNFTLYFPAISKDSKEIDFIESDKSDWKYYGIKLSK